MTSGKSMPQDTGAIMAKSSEINRLDSVPVLMHCGHLNTEPVSAIIFILTLTLIPHYCIDCGAWHARWVTVLSGAEERFAEERPGWDFTEI